MMLRSLGFVFTLYIPAWAEEADNLETSLGTSKKVLPKCIFSSQRTRNGQQDKNHPNYSNHSYSSQIPHKKLWPHPLPRQQRPSGMPWLLPSPGCDEVSHPPCSVVSEAKQTAETFIPTSGIEAPTPAISVEAPGEPGLLSHLAVETLFPTFPFLLGWHQGRPVESQDFQYLVMSNPLSSWCYWTPCGEQ